MILRSSSTPVLGSLLHSFSDSPNNFETNKSQNLCSDNQNKISFPHHTHANFHPVSCNSSPMSHQSFDRPSSTGSLGLRRAQSDGNLDGLVVDIDDFRTSHAPKPRRPSWVMETIPSFSIYNSREEEDEEEEEEEEEENNAKADFGQVNGLERSVTIGDNILPIEGEINCFDEKGRSMVGLEEIKGGVFNVGEVEAPPLFLARGLGIDVGDPSLAFSGGGGGGSDSRVVDFGSGGDRDGDGFNVENYYKKMVEENPCNALFLRNYAQFLYQTKGDYVKAEEYYARALLVEPGDGEILSQYAKLIWDQHHDQERASTYFEQAVQAAPNDSHVLAAYASFLWDTEEEEEMHGGDERSSEAPMGTTLGHGATESASA